MADVAASKALIRERIRSLDARLNFIEEFLTSRTGSKRDRIAFRLFSDQLQTSKDSVTEIEEEEP